MYTSEEYFRDRQESELISYGQVLSYTELHASLSSLSQEQQAILRDRIDVRIMSDSIRRFRYLSTVILSFDNLPQNKCLGFTSQLFIDWERSYSTHFHTILKAMNSANGEGILIKGLEVFGFYASLNTACTLLTLANKAMANVTHLKLVDSVALFQFLLADNLPRHKRLCVCDCWLIGRDLEHFVQKHLVKELSLENISLPKDVFLEKHSILMYIRALQGSQKTGKWKTADVLRG